MKFAGLFILVFALATNAYAVREKTTMKEIKTYWSFNFPIDPAKIYTIPDMDLSYALAGTLVEWSAFKSISAGLASRWDFSSPKVVRFTLRNDLKWSNGEPVTAGQVKESLERGMKTYPEDLRSLINVVEKIATPTDQVIEFHLKIPAEKANLIEKLVEPNYGITRVRPDGSLDLSVSSGPFFLASGSKDELTLRRNPHWHQASPEMADQVVIRKPKPGMVPETVLQSDPWPNLVQTTSLVKNGAFDVYKKEGYSFWERPYDKVVLLELSLKNRNEEGYSMLAALNAGLDRKAAAQGLTGFGVAEQLFPKGYPLHSFEAKQKQAAATVAKRKLKILHAGPAAALLRDTMSKAIAAVMGEAPEFIEIPLQNLLKTKRERNDFDLFMASCGLADPDPEGIMSFFFEGDYPIVPSGKGQRAFIERLDQARHEPKEDRKIALFQGIVADAVNLGHILPVLHSSTVGIARTGIDLSQIPTSDESVTLSRIRFKK